MIVVVVVVVVVIVVDSTQPATTDCLKHFFFDRIETNKTNESDRLNKTDARVHNNHIYTMIHIFHQAALRM